MIATSTKAKLGAAALALAAHGALSLGWEVEEPIQKAGGAGASAARIGTSFADMAAGTLSAQTAQEVLPAVEAETLAAMAPPAQSLPAPRPLAARPAPPPGAAAPVTATAALAPPAPEAARTAEDTPIAPQRSRRPAQRSDAFEARHAAKAQEAKPEPRTTTQPAPRGNADQNARAGSAQGRDDASAKQQGTGHAEAQSGTAAASNYPGAVMARISQVRKPRMRQSGAARVSFAIGASGALASASIARSSGHAELDREALRLIQRAAPFPAPPAGAQRRFAIEVAFR
ncbi:energy transducer TonB family protein [Roseovarius nanhaiticus]|uniref:energy transducer TonB family protein n=1 Tax=Roseovarius nanhaiticus TaxID=573024 RepID=UPI002492F646|nr:TonB family protein [Roseovarius nanhaiticus]